MSWNFSTLGEIAKRDGGIIQTGPFGSQLHQAEYQPEGIPVVMPKDIIDGHISITTIARVSEETATRLDRHKLKPSSIVLPRRGEITKRAFIRNEQEGWLCGTGCLKIELNGNILLPTFLYYFMEQLETVRWLEQHAVGTTMLNLSASIVSALPIRYPSIKSQHEIASILSSHDELIENNQRRIALLEESARLLYQEWFIRLRFPGYEHVRVVDGVPEGWELKTAYDSFQICSGGTPKTSISDYWDGDIPFYTPKDAANGIWVAHCERSITELGLKNCNSKLYPKKTVFISARGTVGKLNMAQRPMAMSQSCYALIGKDHISQIFVYMALHAAVESLRQQAVGAVFDAIVVDTFKRIHILIPPTSIIRFFDDVVGPIFEQVENLTTQSQKLRAARDLLLPRLMSGEIAV
ncbi:type I restriction enzyme, S subunit [Methylomagnum ishizawai]|uniref:Type I restriction enzyme, S subunit n=1 Tax=Methylomagnum ishizawai TaxID=1760988 RepID=A0A1Y6DAN4_9GAMM|nr:restriction endonuclease subunit S [Methylomagnum ishizawai]SMF97224.1 type I restriction enzyme, S subunit [Methylomagnum ishizawai]